MKKKPHEIKSTYHQSTTGDWRLTPGYLREAESVFETAHILFGCFLADRSSKNPLPERPLFTEEGIFEWGHAPPLEKVIRSVEDLEFLTRHPNLIRNAITIIEPWEHVGYNELGEEVRASKNIAFVAQTIADCDSILLPVWSAGCIDPEVVVPLITSGLAVIVEGGMASVHEASTWTHPACSRDDMFRLVEKLLLSRSPTSAPSIFICVGHQLACECHIRLIRRAVREVLNTENLEHDTHGNALKLLKATCEHIKAIGEGLTVKKRNGRQVATSWNDDRFAVAFNEYGEVGTCQLLPYQSPNINVTTLPSDIIDAHAVMADEQEGVIDLMLQYEGDISISMFHSEEANEEAMLFANWAFNRIHDAIVPHRYIIAGSPLSWLIRLPYAIEVLCSTTLEDEILTECSSTCIYYKDFETKRIRRSFTCQFHPELLADLREIGKRPAPSYAELKKDGGIRLFVRLLHVGMQE
jgi:hypothetical protein